MSGCEHGLACAADVYRGPDGELMLPLEALDDEEGEHVSPNLPPIIDAHVHLFPDRLFEAIWRWFRKYGWPIRYPLYSDGVVDFLLSRGVHGMVALHYAHKPDMARSLNQYVANVVSHRPQVTGLATVHPEDTDQAAILEEAFAMGLRGVKLHCHVQAFPIDDPRLDDAYRVCADHNMPMVIHAGREPYSPAYPVHTYAICAAERVERVLKKHPRLTLCIPHLGADEFDAYAAMVRKYDRLWVDTTMAIGGYLPLDGPNPMNIFGRRMERVLYGSDFPNLPYAWDRELGVLEEANLPSDALEAVCFANACELFGITPPSDDASGAPGCGERNSSG